MSAPSRLVVVLCTERSGSTLLAMMLGGHHSIISPPELHVLRYPDFAAWLVGYPQAMASLAWLMKELGEPCDAANLRLRFSGQDSVSTYRELLALCGPERFLVDKSPAYARDSDVLARIEMLKPMYVWLVRHPLGVVASVLSRRREVSSNRRRDRARAIKRLKLGLGRLRDRIASLLGSDVRAQLKAWCDTHSRIEAFLEGIPQDRFLRMHYENLVRSPGEEMRRVCASLGLTPEPNMFHPQEHAPSVLKWDLGDEQLLQHNGIDSEVANRWRLSLTESLLDSRTIEIMDRIDVVRSDVPIGSPTMAEEGTRSPG